MEEFVRSRHGFIPFYRRYTKTWIHALATAGLTAFGMMTFLHRGFAVVAVAVYVLPPILLYLFGADSVGRRSTEETPSSAPDSHSTPTDSPSPAPESPSKATATTDSATDSDDTAQEIDEDVPTGWLRADTPTNATLFDAVVTADGAYAVGEDGVVLADSSDESDESGASETDGNSADEMDDTGVRPWRVALPDGPRAEARDLQGADATDDGAVWFAGDGGSLGRLNPESGRHTDYSAPTGITDNWTAIAVAGPTDGETILLANGSGQVLCGQNRDGDIAWDTPVKPGSGSSLCAATLVDPSVGYLCDTSDGVFETTDGGESFRRVGIDGANGTLTDIAATARDDCAVTADDGVLHRYDGNWTPTRLGDESLWSLAWGGGRAVAAGDTGIIYERAGETTDWERFTTPVTGSLRGAAVGSRRAVAVGEGGAVVVRDR
ncbi:WD40/YVTN/BNR-like repeat-containing protein [Haladaptatus sp. NG-SE-30]